MIEFALIGDLDHEVVIGFSFVPVSLLQSVNPKVYTKCLQVPSALGTSSQKGKKKAKHHGG